MKINEVEALVGITKKNIRFYEAEGLLSPRRNSQNGYRDYGDAEVEALRRIKLLRKLGVPLEEIRQMQQRRPHRGRRHAPPSGDPGAGAAESGGGHPPVRRTLTDRRERLEDLDAQSLLDGWPRWNRRERPL